MNLIDLFMFNEQYTCSLTCKLRWLVYEKGVLWTQMNKQLLFCIKENKQLIKLGKYFMDFNFHGSGPTAKYRENWTM